MTRRPSRSRRLVFVLAAVIGATLAPPADPAAARDEVGPSKPAVLPIQPGEKNEFEPVREQPPADITITESGGGAVPDLGRTRVDPPVELAPDTMNRGAPAADPGDRVARASSAPSPGTAVPTRCGT